MPAPVSSRRFQLDVDGYQLLDEGRRVRLERQPMELLILLARRRGELATREEIAATLWPGDVHVDVDQSINRIIRKLRVALHDDPVAPQFIETVVGKGYRFIGPVEIVERRAPLTPEESPSDRVGGEPAPSAAATPETGVEEVDGTRVHARKLSLPKWAAAVAVPLLASAWFLGTMPRAMPEPAVMALTSYLGDEWFPTFSPDGNQVAFAWNGETRGNLDIYIKQVGSGAPPLRLTTGTGDNTMPAWSPDSRSIAFERQQGTQFALYLISPLGGPERKLTDWLRARETGSVRFSPPSWSPDGKWLVATDVEGDGQTSDIVLIPIGPGERRRIMSSATSAEIYDYPVVAPDGTALAYELCDLERICDVHLIDLGPDYAPKGTSRRVTSDGHQAGGLAWTPDGRSLIYGDEFRRGLYRVSRSGTPAQHLELAGSGAMYPALSRLGNRLAYARKDGQRNLHLWKFAAGGSAAPEGFLTSTLLDRAPHFSPDGKRIVFASHRGGAGDQLWVANQDGSSPMPLTEPTARAQGAPRWSPDSRWIVYNAQRDDGHRDITVIDAEGGSVRHLTADAFENVLPSWSRDGKWIYFGSTRTGRYEIWRIAFTPNSKAEQVTMAGGFAAFESWDGQTLYFTRTNAHKDGPVFAKSLVGGPERRVVESVYLWDFVPVDNGLYYIVRPDPQRHPDGFELRLLDFVTGQNAVFNRFESLDMNGLTVSPDRQTVVSSGLKVLSGSDLMLIENFR
jgi:Tol biopolymer transport system component/DNA-binding winged helix-turn-helix (wHTH) protein